MFKRMTVVEYLLLLAIVVFLLAMLVPPSWFPQPHRKPSQLPPADAEMTVVLSCGAAVKMPISPADDP